MFGVIRSYWPTNLTICNIWLILTLKYTYISDLCLKRSLCTCLLRSRTKYIYWLQFRGMARGRFLYWQNVVSPWIERGITATASGTAGTSKNLWTLIGPRLAVTYLTMSSSAHLPVWYITYRARIEFIPLYTAVAAAVEHEFRGDYLLITRLAHTAGGLQQRAMRGRTDCVDYFYVYMFYYYFKICQF